MMNDRRAWKDFKFSIEPLSKINIKKIQESLRFIKDGDIDGFLKYMGIKRKKK